MSIHGHKIAEKKLMETILQKTMRTNMSQVKRALNYILSMLNMFQLVVQRRLFSIGFDKNLLSELEGLINKTTSKTLATPENGQQ